MSKQTVKSATKKQQEKFLDTFLMPEGKVGSKGQTTVPVNYMVHPKNRVVSLPLETFGYSEESKREYVGKPFQFLLEGPEEEESVYFFLDLDTDPELINVYGWNREKTTKDEDYDMPVIEIETKDYMNFKYKFVNHHIYLNRAYLDITSGKPLESVPRVLTEEEYNNMDWSE